jgi:hypothetical protein
MLIAFAFIACACSAEELREVKPTAAIAPLFQEATNQFTTMKTTLYQYRIQVDQDAGSYKYDCVGFISYSLKHAAPEAWASTVKVTGIPNGRIPNPINYREFLAGLAEKPQPGWQAVTNVSELRPGDIVVWEHKTTSAVGHAVIIGGTPVPGPDNSWSVEVYDSTSSPHTDDSRPNDKRAQVLESSHRPSGLGHGTMVFIANPTNGSLTGLRWSAKAKPITVPIAAGRPTS